MAIGCTRKEFGVECCEPGDFSWRVCNERDAEGIACRFRALNPGERPTHLLLIGPDGDRSYLAIAPERQGNGSNWEWDGDLDRPSLSASIDARDISGIGWHAYLRGGRLEPI